MSGALLSWHKALFVCCNRDAFESSLYQPAGHIPHFPPQTVACCQAGVLNVHIVGALLPSDTATFTEGYRLTGTGRVKGPPRTGALSLIISGCLSMAYMWSVYQQQASAG
uniref:Uncharacterized protein n=1 Tax=Knipowitschia caucasica TaxID=637954 RepID=A0AAV2JBT4_KNICA